MYYDVALETPQKKTWKNEGFFFSPQVIWVYPYHLITRTWSIEEIPCAIHFCFVSEKEKMTWGICPSPCNGFIIYSPRKPENGPLEKEMPFRNHHFQGSIIEGLHKNILCFFFVMKTLFFFVHFPLWMWPCNGETPPTTWKVPAAAKISFIWPIILRGPEKTSWKSSSLTTCYEFRCSRR